MVAVLLLEQRNDGGSHVTARGKCTSNLHQLGLAMLLYANDNDDAYPPSLEILLSAEQLSPGVFICPASSDTNAIGVTTQRVEANLLKPGHMSYIYLGKGLKMKTTPANAVIAYEPLSNHGGKGMNVLYGDGHVEWVDAAEAGKLLKKVAATSRPVLSP